MITNYLFDHFEKPEVSRHRILMMNIYALTGYIITEIAALLARQAGITSISLSELFTLAFIANAATIINIIVIRRLTVLSRTAEIILFSIPFILNIIIFGFALFYAREMRIYGLAFALIAIIIELPFTTFIESILISFGSLADMIAVSWYAIFIKKQSGSFMHELSFALAFVPALLLLALVARQINNHKRIINRDRTDLEKTNIKLNIANARLKDAQTRSKRDFEIASAVQSAFLPEIPDNLKDWDIKICYLPRYSVSGDFFDFFFKDGELKGMTLYDVSGHGISSALLTMIVKPTIVKIFNQMEHESIAHIIGKINGTLSAEFAKLDHYLTGIILKCEGGRVEYTNAGHPDMIIRRKGGRTECAGMCDHYKKGEPLGIRHDDRSYPCYTINMEKDDTLILYTDCLTESSDAAQNIYGEKRLHELVASLSDGSAHHYLANILEDFFSFTGGQPMRDDLTVIVLQKK